MLSSCTSSVMTGARRLPFAACPPPLSLFPLMSLPLSHGVRLLAACGVAGLRVVPTKSRAAAYGGAEETTALGWSAVVSLGEARRELAQRS